MSQISSLPKTLTIVRGWTILKEAVDVAIHRLLEDTYHVIYALCVCDCQLFPSNSHPLTHSKFIQKFILESTCIDDPISNCQVTTK